MAKMWILQQLSYHNNFLSYSLCIYLELKSSAIMLRPLVEMEFYAMVIFMLE